MSWGQPLPPATGARVTRVRVWMPVPQVVVHEVQAAQASTVQSTGQACTLQERVAVALGHTTPPYLG